MIAFSSDEKVAGGGVYLLSFLAGRDVPRIVSFALSRGKRNFAELVPQSAYGRIAEAAFARAVSSGGGQAPCARHSRPTIQRDARPGAASGKCDQVGAGGRCAVPSCRTRGASRACAASRFVRPDQRSVQFIGTGQWDYPNIGGERALIGGWYPAPDPKGWSGFVERYSKTYGAAPPRIASLGYDAVSLAVSLSPKPPGQRYTTTQLTRSSGFSGVDGLFRLLPTEPPSAASPSSKCAKAARK